MDMIRLDFGIRAEALEFVFYWNGTKPKEIVISSENGISETVVFIPKKIIIYFLSKTPKIVRR